MEMTKVQIENHLAGLEKEREFAKAKGDSKQVSAVTTEIGKMKRALGQAPEEPSADESPTTASAAAAETTSTGPPETTAKLAPKRRTARPRARKAKG